MNMQTRISVDAHLLKRATETTGLASNRDIVEHAIRMLLASTNRTPAEDAWQPSLLGERGANSAA